MINHELQTNRICVRLWYCLRLHRGESAFEGLILSAEIPDCCPIIWTLERAKTKIQLTRPLSCETCTVNRAFCEAFCRGDVRAVQYALILEELMVMKGDKDVRKEIGN